MKRYAFIPKTSYLYLVVFLTLFNPILFTTASAKKSSKEKTKSVETAPAASNDIYTKLAQEYLPSLSLALKTEKQAEKEIYKQNKEEAEQRNFDNIKAPVIGNSERIKILFEMAADQYPTPFEHPSLSKTVYKDLELFCSGNSEHPRTVFSAVDRTQTVAGKIALQKMLFDPLTSTEEIQRRQTIIRELINNEALCMLLDEGLTKIKEHESGLIWFWKPFDPQVMEYFDNVYYGYKRLQILNKRNAEIHFLSRFKVVLIPLTGIAFAAHIARNTYHVAKFSYNYLPPLQQALMFGIVGGVLTYTLLTNKMAYDVAKVLNLIENHINEKMSNVHGCVSGTQHLATAVSSSTTLKDYQKILSLKNLPTAEANDLVTKLESSCLGKPVSILRDKGIVLSSFKMMIDSKDHLIPATLAAGEIDAYLSIAKLYKENMQHPRAFYCFAEVINADKPTLELTDVWHPLIDQNVVISNNVTLGGSHPTKDMLITGPNAGGKSTALKSIALGAILAQSFGIVPAKKAVLTPFCAINTYLNIPDSVGQESLFQAEMRRAHELFSSLENLDGNRFALSIMDEIFTGTNPEEGEAGARGVAYNLALLDNSINIVTTHYKGLTTLEEDTNGVIKNFKVSVIEDTEGNITPTYKLERGISHQRVALKLLKKSGFNKNIINTAYAAFNKKQQGQQKITA